MAVKPLIRATLIAAGVLSAGFALTLPAQSQELAALSVPAPKPSVALPNVLSAQDVKLYRQIFDVQVKGKWRTADKLIKQLSDRALMGHVLAQRYLHPTKYRSKYKELKAWMDNYNDHHYAKQIYKLALKRRPKNWKYPAKPKLGRALYNAPNKAAVDKPKRKRLTRSQRRRVATLKRMLKSYLRKGHTLSAKRLVQGREVKKLFDAYNMDWALARLAKGYFMDGRDEWAVEWAEKAAKRSGKYLPSTHWIAGLAHWRLGNLDKSAEHFELSAKYDTSSWTHSASAFWAARAYLIARKPEKVMSLLKNA